MSEEVWKDVVGYEGMYKVSNRGQVTSLDRINSIGRSIKGVMLKTRKRNLEDGRSRETYNHNTVDLCKDAVKLSSASIGRLVLTAFHRSPKEGEVVIYKDGDCTNECRDNLEWGYFRGLCADTVLQIKELLEDGEFEVRQIAEVYNISDVIVNKIGSHYE